MNALEKLMAEFDNDLTFIFRKDMPESLSGLIVDKTVYINANLPFDEAVIKLAEEIGHYETADGNIVDQSSLLNRRLEYRGRKWGYKKLVPQDELKKFISTKDVIYAHDIAEEFEIPENVVEEVIQMYRVEGGI